ncbi:Golgi-associated plant pathogenesis-related protein 1-like, partial [Xenia sp. Carnegie-2017]|uniref:Golgi-associated plant pathogenesis-related protein 1-like n=1 Tax=Xenia sp. Carnegie-2017 TaxID=2897299 RepID=UPI001F03BA96
MREDFATFQNNFANLDYFANDCLSTHNELRAKHGAPQLKWSRELAKDARNWAEYLASTNKMEHDAKIYGKKHEGESIAWLIPAKPKCSQADEKNCFKCSEIIKKWYKEVDNYDFTLGASKHGSTEH